MRLNDLLFDMDMDNLVKDFEAKHEPRKKTVNRLRHKYSKTKGISDNQIQQLATKIRKEFYKTYKPTD